MTLIDPTTDELARYAAAVRAACADLPADDREELLEDLDEHLRDTTSELEADEALTDRLGPPDAYARELRLSAGLPLPEAGTSVGGRWVERATKTAADLAGRIEAFGAGAPGPSVRAYLRSLRPAWWAVRAYAVVSVAALVTSDGWFRPIPHLFSSSALGLIASIVAIVWSVRLGQTEDPSRSTRRLGSILTVAGALAVLVLFARVDDRPGWVAAAEYDTTYAGPGVLTAADGHAITNVFPFASDGTPLEGVLLYDDRGRAMDQTATWDDQGQELIPTDEAAVGNRFPKELDVITWDGARVPGPARPNLAVPAEPEASDTPDREPTTTTAPTTTTTTTRPTTTTTGG